MEGNIAATYTLIYRFLKQQSKNNAAEAVKKAAKSIVVLHDGIEQKGPTLEDIIKEWEAKQNTRSRDTDSSSEDSKSSDGSSSESEDRSTSDSSSEDTSASGSEDKSESDDDDTSGSDDSSDDSDDENKDKKLAPKTAERETSATLSSGENGREITKQVIVQIPEKKSSKDKNESSESDSSDSDSSSNSSDSSDEEEANASTRASPSNTKTAEDKSSSSSESSSDSDDESDSESSQQKEDAHVAKKRKATENGAAVTTAVTTRSQEIARASQKKEKPPPKVQERFQRVNVAHEQMLDNGYEARGGATNDYGQRAHRDLIVTRGAGFRKEKNKKKRGSYRGGEITMENHSIKFDF